MARVQKQVRSTCALCLLQLLQELEPYMQQALDAVDVLREEDKRRQAALEDMIFGFRRALVMDEASTHITNDVAMCSCDSQSAQNFRAFVQRHEAIARRYVYHVPGHPPKLAIARLCPSVCGRRVRSF